MARKASRTSVKGKTLSTTGRIWWSAMARHMASNISREPTDRPWSRALLPMRTPGLTPSPAPATTPMMAICPPIRTALRLCWMVPAPPTSMMKSAPTPPVASRTGRDHSGVAR